MKPNEICPHFVAVRNADGKFTCKHAIQNEPTVCALPEHFICEITLWKQRQSKHISVSQINMFLQCPAKYKLHYLDKLRPQKLAKALFLGSRFHDAKAKIDNGMSWNVVKNVPANCNVTEDDLLKLEITLSMYERMHAKYKPAKPGTHEKQFSVETLAGNKIIGALDFASETSFEEYKYADSPDNYDEQTLRRQLSVYFFQNPKAETCRVLVFPKLRIKTNKKEEEQDFILRVVDKIEDKESKGNWPKIKKYTRYQFNIDEQIKAIDAAVEARKLYEQKGVWPERSDFMCNRCDYKPLCEGMKSWESKGDENG